MNQKEQNKNIKFTIMAILLIVVFCIAIVPKSFQNDTFYTIKIGEYILENGITMKDPFSWHDLDYTYPHWLYDVGTYLIYNVGGFQRNLYSNNNRMHYFGYSIIPYNFKTSKK